MIELQKAVKKYGDRTVLDVSALAFRKGETAVIVGPNGSGKSTLLKIIAGIIKADESNISTEGKILYLPQQSVAFSKTVKKNLLFSCENGKEKEVRCEEILEKLCLYHLKDKNAKTLSGGECQRLALSRILINEADFLILDEPSSAADVEGTEITEKAINEYKEKYGCGIIMTTHSPKQAKIMGDRIIMLCDGKVIEDGKAADILERPKNEWSEKFISQWRID